MNSNRMQHTDPTRIDYVSDCPGNMGQWKERHIGAVEAPKGAERPIVAMIRGWLDYRTAHRDRFEDGIGNDYVLGPAWESIGRAIHSLLDGETGRLDCGTFSHIIHETLKAEGFGEE